MAAHLAPEQADSPAEVLAAVRTERETADRAEARILALAVDWDRSAREGAHARLWFPEPFATD